MSASRKRIATWVACFAIVLNALAPTVSRALAAWQDEPLLWVEISQAAGFKRAHAEMGHAPSETPQDTHSNHGSHCPFCLVHAGSFGLAAPATIAFTAPLLVDSASIPIAHRLPLLQRSTSAQPRAPPFFS